MRVGVGGILHETNTFASGLTRAADFHAYQYAEGRELLEYESTGSELGGALSGSAELGWTVVPTLFAEAVPGGRVEHSAYQVLADGLIEALTVDGQLDGVLLVLHGAMVTTAEEDAEGDLLARVRDRVGSATPVVATVDFHANVSPRMTESVDALVGYDTYPHVDMRDRGREAVRLLEQILATDRRRSVSLNKLPLLTAPQTQRTDAPPMIDVMALVHEWEAAKKVQVTVAPGFPYADSDCTGMAVVASSPDPTLASEAAEAIGAFIWDRRDLFAYAGVRVQEAVDRASASGDTPVIMVDSADNVGGGGPGDGTAILKAWLSGGLSGLLVFIADPESVGAAAVAGVGATLPLTVGGKTDDLHGRPVAVDAYVKLISDGTYEHASEYFHGYVIRRGLTSVLDVNGNTVVLTERKDMPFDPQQVLSLGIDPSRYQAIVVKSAIAWRSGYGHTAGEVIEVDAPGICTGRLSRLGYSAARREMLPPSEKAQVDLG